MPSRTITITSYANVGSYETQFGIVDASTWLWPSSCFSPSPFKVERSSFARYDRQNELADRLVAHGGAQHLPERHRRGDLALPGVLQQPLEVRERRSRQRRRLAPPLRQVAAQRRASLLQVFRFRTV